MLYYKYMAVKLDNLHYSFRTIDGYNKPFNFVISPRELGKTTMMWMKKIYSGWKKNKKPWIYLVRQSVEISDALIESIRESYINKFTDDNVEFFYKVSSFKDGITDVYIVQHLEDGKTENELFIRIVSLNIKMQRIKKCVLRGVAGVFMDEYIINPEFDEKYLPKEADKIKEAYSTWRREADGALKFYFVGNPYSLFNPLFVAWNIDMNKIKVDSFYVGDYFVIHFAVLGEKLKEKLLRDNPLYKFDEEYAMYAVYGTPMNDRNIQVAPMPKNFALKFVFRYQNKNIGIFQNNDLSEEIKFYCKFIDEVSARRVVFCVDFEDMMERTILLSLDERMKLSYFKDSFRKRGVEFEDINCYYFLKEIYKSI